MRAEQSRAEQSRAEQSRAWTTLAVSVVVVSAVAMGFAYPQSLNRPIDEVVVKGAALPGFITTPAVPLDQLHLYRWNGSAFESIPFQIDEIKTWQLVENVASCPAVNLPEGAAVCETNHAFDFAAGGVPGTDETPGLDENDEIVFMARDAGMPPPNDAPWLNGNLGDVRYDIRIVDQSLTVDGEITVNGEAWVSLFRWLEHHDPEYGARHYVEWEAKSSADSDRPNEACLTGDPNTARGLKACGWARGNASATTGQTIEPTLDLRFIGNWTTSRLRVRDAGNTGSPYSDLTDRFKFRLFNENESSWGTGACPRFLGIKPYDPATGASPIRIVRLVQACQSGATTTGTGWYYGTHFRSRIRLRVHPGAGPDLSHYIDYLSQATPLDLYNALHPTTGSPADVIDGAGATHNPTGLYEAPGPNVYNWNQITSTDRGNIVTVVRETRPLLFSGNPPIYYYDDSGNGDSDPPEFQSGRYGNHGVTWPGKSVNMQDEVCDPTKPDDPKGLWREIETIVAAAPAGRNAGDYVDWLERPLQTYPVRRSRYGPNPPPPTPCKPVLNTVNPNNGFRLDLSLSTSCPEATTGYALFRAVGVGSFKFLAALKLGEPYSDSSVGHGATYRYIAYPHNVNGGFGAPSDPVTIAIVDSQPPAAPASVSAEPLTHGAQVSWETSTSFDTVSYDVFASTSPGGPYQKLTAQPVPIPARAFTASSLDPNTTYYLVVKANDLAGNAGPFSPETFVTPLP